MTGEGRKIMDSSKKNILIVDDNKFFLQQQIACLDKERFEIQTAASGKEALAKIRSTPPDLILLDQIMEDMMGPDICRTLKADPATEHIPIIIISSGERENARLETSKAGCDGIIFKPIRRNQLLGLVEEYLGVAFRKWDRALVNIPCQTICDGLLKEGTIHSLSGGGAFIEESILLLRGDTCQIRFSLPGQGREVIVREAMVVWLGQHDIGESGQKHGVGFKFLTISPEDQEAIDNYVAAKQQ
jgi:CheY-like chemotaxis protein